MQEEIKSKLKKILNEEVFLEIPPDPKLGDYAFPCFSLAKKFRKNPNEIAFDLSKKIKGKFRVEVNGAYLNFFIDKGELSKKVIIKILKEKESYGKRKNKKNILIEYPSPNTNKPLHLGHVRNIALGNSLSNLLEFIGNNVKKVNLNNDRGIHICKSMLAYKKFGNNKKPDKKSDHFVGDFYVLFEKELQKNKELENEAYELLKNWENNEKETINLWKKMNKWALNGFNETYNIFNLKFDKIYNESAFYNKGKVIIDKGLKKGLFKKGENNEVFVDLGEELGKKVLLRPDGTSVYITQDLYLAELKFKDFPKTDLSIYVVANEQNYHFKVLFKILEFLNLKAAKKSYHLSYGYVSLPEGRMKSREGTVVDADDLVEEIVNLAKKEIEKRYSNLSKKEIERRANIIGLGAIIFFILKIDPFKDMIFHPEKSISFEGDTGPYVQYSYARCSSILRNGKVKGKSNYNLFNDYDIELVKLLEKFPDIVNKATQKYKPSLVANYLLELSRKFSEFYDRNPVLKEENNLRNARLNLIKSISVILKSGLNLLNIKTLEEM
mgnify:CR=1 FL=1